MLTSIYQIASIGSCILDSTYNIFDISYPILDILDYIIYYMVLHVRYWMLLYMHTYIYI